MEYIGSNNAKYTLENTPFKKGGEGSVYNIVGKPNCVAKIYHGSVITAELESKIKYITNNPPSKTILDQIAWPLDYLRNANGQFVGFVMPKLKIDAELGELYKYPPKKIKLTNEQKLVVAINICRVISEVHKAGYVFGDFNPCNIGVNLTTGNVAFLDTDSYHIYDKNTQHTYRCSVCLPGYVAPELIKRCKGTDFKSAPLPTFTQESDRFALAIHIFKLLFNGYTPFNGIPENITSSQASPGQGNEAIEKDNYCFKPGNKPMSASVPPMDSFPPEICDLFSRAFIVGRYNATLRPTAEEWDKALCDYRNNLVVCAKNPLHAYYKDLQDCPYCQAELNYNLTLSGKKVYGNTSSGSVSQLNFSNPVAVPVSSTSSNRTSSRGSVNTSSKASITLTGAINQGKSNQKQIGFRKKLKIGFVLSLIVLFLLSVLFASIFVIVPSVKYNNAIEYMNNGEYAKALEIWESFNREYKDSEEKRIETEQLYFEVKYNEAIAYMDEKDYISAIEIWDTFSKEYKDSNEKKMEAEAYYKIQLISEAEVGEVVILGEYEQDNDIDNGKEEIEWLVLAKEEDKALLISKYVLDNTPFNEYEVRITWETCTARKFLNNSFYKNAFNNKTRDFILTTTVEPADNAKYGFSGGNQTSDKLFLLSLEEARLYFDVNEERVARATKYAAAKGTYNNGDAGCWWWLRTPSSGTGSSAVCVYYHGEVDYDKGSGVHDDKCGVRPAMWVSINN